MSSRSRDEQEPRGEVWLTLTPKQGTEMQTYLNKRTFEMQTTEKNAVRQHTTAYHSEAKLQ